MLEAYSPQKFAGPRPEAFQTLDSSPALSGARRRLPPAAPRPRLEFQTPDPRWARFGENMKLPELHLGVCATIVVPMDHRMQSLMQPKQTQAEISAFAFSGPLSLYAPTGPLHLLLWTVCISELQLCVFPHSHSQIRKANTPSVHQECCNHALVQRTPFAPVHLHAPKCLPSRCPQFTH